MYSFLSSTYHVMRAMCSGFAWAWSSISTMFNSAWRTCATKSCDANSPCAFQPTMPLRNTMLPLAATPLAYPLGRGHRGGCKNFISLLTSRNTFDTYNSRRQNEGRDALAQRFREWQRPVRTPVHQHQHNFSTHALALVRPAKRDVGFNGACAQTAHKKFGSQHFTQMTGRDKVRFQMHRRQSPAILDHNIVKRKIQSRSAPVFHQVIEHLQEAGIKNDPRRIAIGKAH